MTAPQIRILQPGDEALLEALLEQHRDSSMFLRGNWRAGGLVDQGKPFQCTYAAAFDDGQIVGVAAHCWTGNLLLQAPRELPRLIAAALKASGRGLRGFAGPYAQVEEARACVTGVGAALHSEPERLLALDLAALRLPPGPGLCRLPREDELPLLSRWRADYLLETGLEQAGPGLLEAARGGIAWSHSQQALYVLEQDGQVVAMTAFNSQAPGMVQVGGVYTPPALRSRGHARRAVGGSLAQARSRGVTRAVLFTQRSNAPALAAYRSLGFEVVGDYGLLLYR